jgi:hypothetical protein
MLLLHAVVRVAKLVHENMQKHERASLCLREPAYNSFLSPVVREAKAVENPSVSDEI